MWFHVQLVQSEKEKKKAGLMAPGGLSGAAVNRLFPSGVSDRPALEFPAGGAALARGERSALQPGFVLPPGR